MHSSLTRFSQSDAFRIAKYLLCPAPALLLLCLLFPISCLGSLSTCCALPEPALHISLCPGFTLTPTLSTAPHRFFCYGWVLSLEVTSLRGLEFLSRPLEEPSPGRPKPEGRDEAWQGPGLSREGRAVAWPILSFPQDVHVFQQPALHKAVSPGEPLHT